VALRQRGPVSHRQLRALGFSGSAIQRRVAAGYLHVIHRGVYAVGHAALGKEGRLMAAVLAGGAGALVSHRSAAAMHGVIDDSRATVDVVTATRRRRRGGIGFHRSRTLHPDDRSEIDGIPVTSLARTLLDLAEVVPPRRLDYAVEQADRQGRLDLRALNDVIRRNGGRRGVSPLKKAIASLHPEAKHAHRGLESDFLRFCREHELPDPTMNVAIGEFTVDAVWKRQRLVVELDSWTEHRGRTAFEKDRRRDAALRLAGYTIVRVTDRWMREDPVGLAQTLRALLASAPPSRAATA
jgi:very-short-patch-repair endonuclease